jgi:hypothetical protein
MKILPYNEPGARLTGRIDKSYTVEDINRILGFKPNAEDDEDKVKYSWGFKVDGQPCGIWDWKGTRWSVFGPQEVFDTLFPKKKKKK